MTLFTLVALFILVFLAVLLLGMSLNQGKAEETRKTLSRLEAIATTRSEGELEEPLDLRREEQLSQIPWVDRVLKQTDITNKLRLMLAQADLKWTVARLLLMSLFAFLLFGYVIYLRTEAVLLAMLVGLVGASLPFIFVRWKRGKRFDKIREQLPEALDTMVAAIRAGHSFNSALGMTAKEAPDPVRGEFRQCFDEQNFGLDLRVSLGNLEHRVPLHDIRIMVAAILIQRESGGNLTEILEKVAYLIREDFRLQRQVRVHTAQGRLTGWILSILPVVLTFLLYLINPEHMSLLWKRSIGLKLLYGATVMTVIGALIIRKIVNIRI